MAPLRAPAPRTRAVGVVLPVHDEELLLPAALRALGSALAHPMLSWLSRVVAVVLDGCRDRSGGIVAAARGLERLPARLLVLDRDGRNVGAARRAGCDAVLAAVPRVDPAAVWLATTDADSRVPHEWLAVQVARHEEGADVWTGTVTVEDWSGRAPGLGDAWRRSYESDTAPTHGTSLGFNGAAYLAAGGFEPVRSGEDRCLYAALLEAGAAARHDRHVPVVTSARRGGRAPDGFAQALTRIEAGLPRD